MASRRLILDASVSRPDGKLTYRLDASGDVDEGDIERELLPLLYKYHPALDDTTGGLKQEPGARDLFPLGPEFFLSPPDEKGMAHLGGMRLPVNVKEAFLLELHALGWTVEE